MLNKIIVTFNRAQRQWLLSLCLLCNTEINAQRIGNYVANGSFEEQYDCVYPHPIMKIKNWLSIDSVSNGGVRLSVCAGNVPYLNTIFQYPHTGETYVLGVFYYPTTLPIKRTYAKNRLKSTLQAGKIYCVRFYVNIENGCSYGIDGIGVYFGGNEIDTITKCNAVLSYIAPQVQNSQGNIITDTLNWIAITGTFTANGTEKYLLLGNFLSDNDTDTLMINPTNLPLIWTDVGIDDVSCIPIDLEAYAGRDTTIYIGDSTYIGREPDFAIDTGCVWYQLPNSTTAIDTVSGMWVKPNATGSYTYVVRQELNCSALKWDTVVVTVRDFDVGIKELKDESLELRVYPNPANDKITLTSNKPNEELRVSVVDITGRIVMSRKAEMKNYIADVELPLMNGAYIISITNEQGKTVTKKLLIAK